MKQSKPARYNTKKTAHSSGSLWLYAGLGILAVLVLAGIFLLRGSPPAAQGLAAEVSVDQALSMRESGAFVLDVRQPEEWVDHHVPGSALIPLGELEARLDEVPKDQEIIVVCRSGNRSAQGRDILLDAGFEQVTSMAGGLTDWRAAGYPTVSGP
jgi:rhodanese-related sulfurtransferase